MATGIKDVLTGVVEALNAADVSCVADPANLNPPAVLAAIEAVHPNLMDGSGSVDVRLNLCSPDVAWEDALAALDELLAAVVDAVDVDDPVTPETLVVSGANLPSLRCTVTYFYERTE